jgi:hypothetical protein
MIRDTTEPKRQALWVSIWAPAFAGESGGYLTSSILAASAALTFPASRSTA